ncbi:TPA: hypothetical protein N0F65_003795 [Lagenidium giganteum]|uniref:PhoD-like phosphatase metallophosphatase domain-containing protein n=1 Tax=Lagenidium giganteum TaxID=4803 RepID=A0AAV2YZ63_9STRA|nr:TPA: hypothetical protein N0F65_003795 [Lagenidium giganteum]
MRFGRALAVVALLGATLVVSAHGAPCTTADVTWIWKGALTSHSLTFKFGLKAGHTCKAGNFVLNAHPVLRAQEKPHSALVLCRDVPGIDTVKSCELADLPHADRQYRYELLLLSHTEGKPNQVAKSGTFRTPPVEGSQFDFRFAFSSCADEASDATVFQRIAADDPLFFLHMGDLHYANLEVNDPTLFRGAFESMFASTPGQAMLAMDLPFAYMWDDHDYGPDNSDKTAPGRNASVQVYREYVPHYPMPGNTESTPYGAIYQAFTVGRVRFILTDLRSERTPNLAPDVPSKTVLGAKQKKWFKEELVRATNDPSIGLIIWCSTMPWIDDQRKWGYFTHEQRDLIHYMQGHALNKWKPIVIISGDAHMLAVDDGSNSPGNLTTFHAAALGKPGSIKGGPYSHGLNAGSGQYGLLDVKDDGKRVCLHYQGINIKEGVLIEYDTCHPERTPPKNPYIPPPKIVRSLQRAWKKASRHFWYAIPTLVLLLVLLISYLKSLQKHAHSKKQR